MARSSDPPADGPRPFVFATVGTDHHPFDRLVGWIDAWTRSAGPRVDCLVQTGTAHLPERADWVAYLSHDELLDVLSRAVAVVSHGGPATIVDCRRAGLKPIVVPRRRALKEHVDDHQLLFSRRAAAASQIELVETEHGLRAALDVAIGDPAAYRIGPTTDTDLAASIRRFAAIADPLVGSHADGGAGARAVARSSGSEGISTPRGR